ncbi:MAG: hypothetical protein WD118_05345 [Phycisphaeraceae bacterium]
MNAREQNTSGAATAPRRRRRLRWLGLAGALLVLLAAVVVLLAPTLLSVTGPGRRATLAIVSSTVAGSIDAERVSLAWFGGQSFHDVTLNDPEGAFVASIRRFEAPELRLLPLLMGTQRFGHVIIEANTFQVRQLPGQPTNLQRAVQTPGTAPDDEPEPADPDEPMAVDEDLSVHLHFTADRITYEAPGVDTVQLTDVAATVDMLDIRRIGLNLQSNLVHGDQPGRVDLNLQLHDAFAADGQAQFAQTRIEGQGELANFPLEMADRILGQEGRLALLLGEQLDAQLTATGPLRQLEADVRANSPRMTANLQLVGDEQALRAAPGSELQLQITEDAFAAWTAPAEPGEAPPATLLQPVTLNAQLDEFVLPRNPDAPETIDFARIVLNMQATADDLLLDVPDTGRVALRQTQLTMQARQLGDELEVTLQGVAEVGDVSEAVSGRLAVRRMFAENQPMEATLATTALPVALVDVLAQQDGLLVLVLGDTLATTVDLQRTAAGDMSFAGQLDAPRLRGPFEGSYDADGAMAMRTPEPMTLLLTDALLARLTTAEDGNRRLSLEESAEVAVNIEQLRAMLLSPDPDTDPDVEPTMRFDPQRTSVVGDINSVQMIVRDLTSNERFTIDNARMTMRGENLEQLLEIDLDAQIEQLRQDVAGAGEAEPAQRISRPADEADDAQAPAGAGEAEPSGRISSQTRIIGLLSSAGEFQPAAARVQSSTTLASVPSMLLDTLGGQGGTLAAILGPRTSASAQVDYQGEQGGTADLDLRSDNAGGQVRARVTPDMVAELREDAVLQLQVTPEMSEVLLSSINPFITGASSAEAIRLTVREQGFAMPLRDFDINAVSANGGLELGTLQVTQGPVSRLFFGALSAGLTAAGGRPFDPGETFVAQFTPTTFTADRGTLTYRDMRMQTGDLTLAFRGRVLYEQERFDLTVGLPGQSLAQLHPSLGRVVGAQEELSVPLTGTFDDPQLNTSAMVREMSQLALRAGLREGLDGRVPPEVGGVLDAILGGSRQRDDQPTDDDEDAPERETPDREEQQPERAPSIFDLLRERRDR